MINIIAKRGTGILTDPASDHDDNPVDSRGACKMKAAVYYDDGPRCVPRNFGIVADHIYVIDRLSFWNGCLLVLK